MTWYLFIFVFLVTAVIDAIFVIYADAVVGKRPFVAAFSSTMCHLISAGIVLSYVEDARYLVAVALGSFVGTYWIMLKIKKDSGIFSIHNEPGDQKENAGKPKKVLLDGKNY